MFKEHQKIAMMRAHARTEHHICIYTYKMDTELFNMDVILSKVMPQYHAISFI